MRTNRLISVLVSVASVCALATCTRRPAPLPAVKPSGEAVSDLRQDVAFLASDDLQGRLAGEPGIAAAEQYIAERFEEAGLAPIPGLDGFFQDFTITRTGFLPGSTSLVVGSSASPGGQYLGAVGVDFRPLSESGAGEVDGELVFAGYGIVAAEAGHNDYDGLNVRGKIALVLRGEPEPDDPASPFHGPGFTHHAYFRTKAEVAFRRGAAGVIVVNPIGREERRTDFTVFDSFRLDTTGKRNPLAAEPQVDDQFIALFSSQSLLEWAAGQWGLAADRVAMQANSGVRPLDLLLDPLPVRVSVSQMEPKTGIPARNVAAMAPGADPDRIILVGAHHDHLGTITSGTAAGSDDVIFNGADDNASGAAAVLEIGRQLAGAGLNSTVYFVTFSSEEHGLLGSTAFVSSQLPHLPDLDLMINIDMAGRNPEDPLVVLNTGGLRLGGASLESVAEEAGARVAVVTTGVGGSDHIPFQQIGVPIVFVTSDKSDDYHGVDDEADRIHYDRLQTTTAFVRDIIVAASGN